MYISILNKVVKIIEETIEKNGSHDRALRYAPEITLLNSLSIYIINADTPFMIQEIGTYIKY